MSFTAQRPELEQLGESDASDTKVGPQPLIQGSWQMPRQERVFFDLNVSPSAQAGLISESSIETSIAGEGQHAEDLRQGQQQKRKRASDLQDKGT